jgi:hypothetical protein
MQLSKKVVYSIFRNVIDKKWKEREKKKSVNKEEKRQ